MRGKSMIDIVFTDCDGVLTDNGVYYNEAGEELKRFSYRDGMGFELLRNNNIKTGIITSENDKLIKKRAEKLKVDYLITNSKNKLEDINKLFNKVSHNLDNLAYIGDDINDLSLLKNAAVSGAPSNAQPEIHSVVDYITKNNGGYGAFREFVNYIIRINDK